MTLREPEIVELHTPTGPMRTLVLRPAAAGRFPGLLFHSEIFQLTAPICRTAASLAGHGFIVAVPEIYPGSCNRRKRKSWSSCQTGGLTGMAESPAW